MTQRIATYQGKKVADMNRDDLIVALGDAVKKNRILENRAIRAETSGQQSWAEKPSIAVRLFDKMFRGKKRQER